MTTSNRKKIKNKTKGSKLATQGMLAAIAGTMLLSGEAEAQAVSLVDVAAVKGIASVQPQPDGSLLVTTDGGQTYTIPPGAFTVQNGQFLVPANFADDLSAWALSGTSTGFSPALIALGVAVAAGVGVALAVSGGDDDPGEGTDGNDLFLSDASFDIDGGEGIDTVDFSSATQGVNVDLDLNTPNTAIASQDGAILNAPPNAGGQQILELDDIENVIGSNFDDVIFGNNEINTINGGAGDDTIHSFGGADIVDGGTGIDTLLLAATPVGTEVTLDESGSGTVVINGADADVFSNFENVTGSATGDDILTGNSSANVLNGNGGDDVLSGLGGDDTLLGGDGDDILAGGGGTDIIDGGAGIDTNSFEGIGLGVTATVAADGTGTASYGQVNETFTGIENLTGTDNDDILTATGAASNVLIGGAGDDFISGGGGSDITDGGEGIDTVSFADIGPAVTVSVDETGTGSAFYTPPSGVNVVDTLANFEIIEGREGDGDTIDVSSFSEGVRIDLDTNTPTPGPNSQDGVVQVAGETVLTLSDFENIVGTDFDDVLLGNNEFNVIDGGAGNDAIHSFGGADELDGGTGIDTLLLTATPVGTEVTLDESGSGTVVINGADADVFSNFENVTGSVAGDDILTGNSSANVLNGNGGDDVLSGLGGADTLIGGAGDDFISGGGGSDITDGGEGIDTVSFADIGPAVTVSVDETGTGSAFYTPPSGVNVVDTLANFEIIEGREGDGDTIDVSSFSEGVRIDLDTNTPTPGPNSQDGVVQVAGETVLTLSDFENIVGTDFDDVLLGNNEFNVIDGGAGNDAIHSFGGADELDGGTGIDTLLLTATPVGTEVTLDESGSGTVVINGADADVFSNFENVTGSAAGDDILTGNQVDNVLNGNGGDDILTGGLGNDTLIGGAGVDTADFSDIDVPVTITVDADGNGTAVRDTGFSVEVVDAVVDGSAFGAGLDPASFVSEAVAGNIYFNIHTSEFTGGEIRGQLAVDSDVTDASGVRTIELSGLLDAAQEPNDASDSEATGSATLTITVAADGTVTYSSVLDVEGIAPSELISLGAVSAIHLHNAPAGVNGPVVQDFIVDAGNAGPALPFTVVDAVTETDTLESIEEFILSDDNDVFTATGAASQTINGGDGDDVIAAGGGTDFLDGGAGNDTNSFAGIGFGVTATVNADGTGTADYGPVSETFVNFENLTGSANNDVLIATGAAANVLIGGDGDDLLAGGGGTDVIDGGAGIDTNSFQGIGLGVTATVAADGTGTASYGQVNETFTGIENLTGTDNDDVLIATGAAANVLIGGDGDDLLAGGGGTDVIDGGAGIDTNSFQGIGLGVTATVNADGTGTASYGQVNETFTGIENLTGSDNDDVLTALGAAANVLSGEAGNDTLSGGGGGDTLLGGDGDDILAGGGGTDIIDGGAGIDTNSFAGIGLGVTATLAADGTGTAVYGNINETFTGIENLTGTDNDDVLIATGAAANVISGGDGDDLIAGGGGTDVLDGGAGNDTNSFQGIGFGVTATINADGTGTADYGPVSETFVNFENLLGSSNDDVLIATGVAANIISGGDGDDLIAGGGGTDVLDGGAGNDTNSFQGIGFGVTASLATGTASYGPVNETFTNFENLLGSSNDDNLTGDAGVNILDGADGDDVLNGGAGDDILDGGAGIDTAVFEDIAANITVTNNGDGTLTVVSALDGTDTLSNIESLLDGAGNAISIPTFVNVLESGTNDLSGSGAAPTAFTLVEGINQISNVVVNSADANLSNAQDVDIFTVTVPVGSTLTSIELTNFVSADDRGFIGLVEGDTFPADSLANGFDVSLLLGQTLFGTGNAFNAGENGLVNLGSGAGAIGFDGNAGLGAGTYTFLVQQIGNNPIDFTFDFIVEETSVLSSGATTSSSAPSAPVFTSVEDEDAPIFIDAGESQNIQDLSIVEDTFDDVFVADDVFEVA